MRKQLGNQFCSTLETDLCERFIKQKWWNIKRESDKSRDMDGEVRLGENCRSESQGVKRRMSKIIKGRWKVDDEVLLNQKTRMSMWRASCNLLVRDIVKSWLNPGSREMNYENEHPICERRNIMEFWRNWSAGIRDDSKFWREINPPL